MLTCLAMFYIYIYYIYNMDREYIYIYKYLAGRAGADVLCDEGGEVARVAEGLQCDVDGGLRT